MVTKRDTVVIFNNFSEEGQHKRREEWDEGTLLKMCNYLYNSIFQEGLRSTSLEWGFLTSKSRIFYDRYFLSRGCPSRRVRHHVSNLMYYIIDHELSDVTTYFL